MRLYQTRNIFGIMNNKKYHTVRTVPKYIRKIKGRCKIDTPTHMMADFLCN
jgi:hypothetical protein